MKLNPTSPHAGDFRALAKILALALLFVCPRAGLAQDPPPCGGDTVDRCWTGAENGLWSNPNNWLPVGVPRNGELLRFNFSTTVSMVNDLPNLVVRALWFFDFDFVLSGNLITFAGSGAPTPYFSGIVNFGGERSHTTTINCPIGLGADAAFESGGIAASPVHLRLNGPINLNGHTLFLESQVDAGRIEVSSVISGNGDVRVRTQASSSIEFKGFGNTFRGTLTVGPLADGTITFNKETGVVVNDGLTILGVGNNTSVVRLSRSEQIGDDATVTLVGSGRLSMQGHNEAIGHLVLSNAPGSTVSAVMDTEGATLTVLGDVTSWNLGSGVLPAIKGQLNLLFGGHTFEINGSAFYGLDVQGEIRGAGRVIKTGDRALILRTNTTFTGGVSIDEGIVEARHALAFGTTAGDVILRDGSITLNNVIISGETLFVQGTRPVTANTRGSLLTGQGLSGWQGRIELETNLVVNSTDLCLIGGPVVGPGGFEFIGSRHSLSGASVQPNPSTFTGLTRVLCELLQVSEEHALRGPLVVGGGFGGQSEIRWAFPSLARGVPEVTVHPNGLVNLNGRNENFLRLIMNGGRVITGAGFLTVARIITNPTNVTATIEGNLGFSSFPTTEFTVADGPATPDLAISAVITDGTLNAVGIVKRGEGELRLSGANDYDGPTRIDAGVVHIQNNTALGTTAAGTTVANGATLQVEAVAALPEPLNIRGAGRGGTLGALNFFPATGTFGPIVLDGPATVRVDSSFAILSSAISGTGPLTKLGAGTLQFGGGSGPANTYTGDTIVEEGILVLSKGTGVTTVPGHLVIGGGGGLFGASATVRHFAGFTILGGVTLNRGGLWDLNGFSESFSAAALQGRPALTLNVGSDVQTGVGTLTLPVGGDVVVNPGTFPGASSLISGNLALDPGPHRFIVQSGVSGIGIGGLELDVSAVISQTSSAADIVKEGSGNMRLGGANSFTGPVTVDAGGLTVANALALGTAAAGTFVNGNASLALDGGFEVAGETLTLDSTNAAALLSLGPVTNTWRGNIVLQRTAGIRVQDARGAFTHFGGSTTFDSSAISGPGGFTKSGPGSLFIAGLQGGNSYTGPTTVTDGLLEALRRSSLSGNIVVAGANSALRTARATGLFPARTVLPTGASVTVQDGALWTMNGTNFETLSRLQGDGRLTIGTGGGLTVSNSVSCEFSGPFSGSGALNKYGLATFHVTGNSSGYTGPATVFDGTYKVDGFFGMSPVTVKNSSILRGYGAVGDVTVENGGVVRVDSGRPGQLGGDMQMNSANFQNGGVLGLAFFGPHPTAGNDSLFVLNAVTLTSPTLSSGFNYPPREGDVITLVRKIAAGPVSGAIGGFPQGAVRLIGGVPVVMSYAGGDGNDVTLTVTNLPLHGGGAQLVSGNGGGALVPNDCSQLWLVVTNRGAVALTGLRGKLRSLTPGVVVTMAESSYADLAPNARGSNATPFQIRTEPSFGCGGGAEFELVLTASNFPPTAVAYTLAGSAGHALGFNGSGNYVAVPHTSSLNAFPLTVTMWVNATSGGDLVNKYVSSSLNGWDVFMRSGRVRAWYFRDNTRFIWDGGDGLNGGIVADGNWHHVAFTVDASGGKLYVDGVLKDSRAWTGAPGAPTTTQEVHLGIDAGRTIPLNGHLDEVTIWRTALSQTQIQTNLHRSLTGTEANLVAYYRCDEASGATVRDSAPNIGGDNHGAWVGTPLFAPSGVAPFSVPGGVDCNSGGGTCESCLVVSGQFDTNALETVRRLTATGAPSVCDPPKPCPGFDEFTNAPVRHVLHHFTNSTAVELCVTAQLHVNCTSAPAGAYGVASYLGEFRINQPCSNYLGDDGAAEVSPLPFSFRVPPQTNFLIVVTARIPDLVCETYALELFGLPCPPPTVQLATRPGPGPLLIQWSSAYPDYRLQSVNTLSGSSPTGFINVTSPPVLLDGKYTHSNAVAAPRQFFRLAK